MSASRDELPPRPPGRPRDARVDDAIVDAACEVLADLGPAGFTVDAVAGRAGVGKATIYRRWPSRGELLLGAAHQATMDVFAPNTGSMRSDLVLHLTNLASKLQDTVVGRLLPALLAEASANPEVEALLTEFVHERRQVGRSILVRGVERGELPESCDLELTLDLLGGPIFMRALLTGAEVDRSLVEQIIDRVLPC